MTRAFLSKKSMPSRALGQTGYWCSLAGFGTYRVAEGVTGHREALASALKGGINLIDTSSNYGGGEAEKLVGRVLTHLFEKGEVRREELIVVSKAGYVQASALTEAHRREESGGGFPEMVKYLPDCWHCIHPEYLRYCLEQSLQRTGLDYLDFYLLHNPEYFFSDAFKHSGPEELPRLRDEFYARIQKAFAYLETEVAAGRLRGYGVSSNTLGAIADSSDATSLSRFWESAEKLGSHHFQIVQLPLNLLESGPFLESNCGKGDGQTALAFAVEKGLGVLANRPLNAFANGHLVRLADFPKIDSPVVLEKALERVQELEAVYAQKFAPKIDVGEVPSTALFRWGQELEPVLSEPLTAEHWQSVEGQARGQLDYLLREISTQLKLKGWPEWREDYAKACDKLFEACRKAAVERSQRTSDTFSMALRKYFPDEVSGKPLAQKALSVVGSTPGVACVLNGMRTANYVQDALEACRLPGPTDIAGIYGAFQR